MNPTLEGVANATAETQLVKAATEHCACFSAGHWKGGEVAVKVMQSAGLGDEGQLEAFKREVQVLSALRHPHIVRLLGACLVLPHLCIVQELATGGSLYDKLHGPAGQRADRPLPYLEVRLHRYGF